MSIELPQEAETISAQADILQKSRQIIERQVASMLAKGLTPAQVAQTFAEKAFATGRAQGQQEGFTAAMQQVQEQMVEAKPVSTDARDEPGGMYL